MYESQLFSLKVYFQCPVISLEGIHLHHQHFNSLVSMKKPSIASELQQHLCVINLMRTLIPNYAAVIELRHNLMEAAYAKISLKRTKGTIRNISVTTDLGGTHDHSFTAITEQLAAAVKLSRCKSEFEMYLFTDASGTDLSAIIAQVYKSQRNKKIDEQQYEPTCFLSGAFESSSKNWSVPEKEGFAIGESMCRANYLIMVREFSISTDHPNPD